MNSTLIHIGYHKSASTYLQKKFFPRLEANYVFLSGHKRAILDLVESEFGFDENKLTSWVKNEAQRHLREPLYDLTLISHEELSGHPHGHNSVNPFITASNFKCAFPTAKILVIIRNQFEYLRSIYAYRVVVKGRETRRFFQFLSDEGELGLFEKLEYDQLVNHYIELFGMENVLVLPLELLSNSVENFCNLICDFIEVPRLHNYDKVLINESSKSLFVINIWRPINLLFSWLLEYFSFISSQ